MAEGIPELSAIVVSAGAFSGIRRLVRHLREQRDRERIELVIVAATGDVLSGTRPGELVGFHGVRVVAGGRIGNVDVAAAHGVRAASAPVVALLEDHAYPAAGWAEAVIATHRRGWPVVGAAILNANPASLLSWGNHCIAYGRWPETGRAGPAHDIARHNSTFSRDVLLGYGRRIDAMLGAGNGFLDTLRADGHAFYFEPRARVYHANVSALSSTLELRFQKGRHFASERAARSGWPPPRRLLFALAAAAFPLTRLVRERRELFGNHSPSSLPRALLAVLFTLCIDAAGQMAGFAFGPGSSRHRVARFEFDRRHHMTARDRLALAE